MRFLVLDASTSDGLGEWLRLWAEWPDREPMAHPEYARLFARPADRVVALAGVSDGGAILFPLLLRPLAAEPWAAGDARWDAVSPYGYGGPFAWGSGRDDAAFWRAHAAWCRDQRVVSTFARLSLFPEQLADLAGPIEERGPNVVVPLDRGLPALWHGYEHNVRRWIRVARRAGIAVEVDLTGERLGDFLAVYTHTMLRRDADEGYFFPRTFFDELLVKLPGQWAFFHARAGDGAVVSTELVLVSPRRIYSFLGGTLDSAFQYGPNYLLKHDISEWGAAQGKREFVLGGGFDARGGILRYKRGFAHEGVVPFRVAKLVHDPAAYEALVAARAEAERAAGGAWAPADGYFPAYRA